MPAGLPSFKDLAEQVLMGLCPSRRKDPLPWKAFDENRFDEALDILRPLLADPSVLKIGHNLKYDMVVLRRYGITISPVDDTMLMS